MNQMLFIVNALIEQPGELLGELAYKYLNHVDSNNVNDIARSKGRFNRQLNKGEQCPT